MKMQFTMVLKGEDSLNEKFKKTLCEHPNTHMDLIKSFAQAVMMAFRLDVSDNITIESFRAGRIEDKPEDQVKNEVNPEEMAEKKVEN